MPVEAVRAAGRAGLALADAVRGIVLTGAGSAIGDALPGGAAERAADRLQVAWTVTRDALAQNVAGHAGAMVAAADDYAAAEQAATASMAGAGPR